MVFSPVAIYFGLLLRLGVENYSLHLKLNLGVFFNGTQPKCHVEKDIGIPKGSVLRLILHATKMQLFLYCSKLTQNIDTPQHISGLCSKTSFVNPLFTTQNAYYKETLLELDLGGNL